MTTWNDCDKVLREIALLDLAIADADAVRDAALLEAQQAHKRVTAPLAGKKEALEAELETFYRTHRKEVEAEGRRSRDLYFGRVGMRKGNPALKLAKGWKWDRVLQAVKDQWARSPLLPSLVSTTEKVNKDGLKTQLDEAALLQIGLRIKQDDEFFYETFPEKVRKETAA